MKWTYLEDAYPPKRGKYLVSYHPGKYYYTDVTERLIGVESFMGGNRWACEKTKKVYAWANLPRAAKRRENESSDSV